MWSCSHQRPRRAPRWRRGAGDVRDQYGRALLLRAAHGRRSPGALRRRSQRRCRGAPWRRRPGRSSCYCAARRRNASRSACRKRTNRALCTFIYQHAGANAGRAGRVPATSRPLARRPSTSSPPACDRLGLPMSTASNPMPPSRQTAKLLLVFRAAGVDAETRLPVRCAAAADGAGAAAAANWYSMSAPVA